MSKRDLTDALAQTVSSARQSGAAKKFERAEEYLETDAKKAAPIAPNAPSSKTKKKRNKVIRDTFSFPQEDYLDIKRLQDRLISMGLVITKSEALRLGLKAALGLDDRALNAQFLELEKLKPGRPKGE